jgi:outer membrane protein OmpA-like peptidoglycan-associated protein
MPGFVSRGHAQVSVDMRALDPSGAAQPAAREAPRRPDATSKPASSAVPAARKPAARGKAVAANAASHKTSAQTSSPSGAGAPAPVSNAPASSVPIPVLPAEQPAAPPASTTVPATAPSPVPLPPPVRLVFESGHTDLTPYNEAEIKDLARAIPVPAASSVNVLAYAAGRPDDPSTARRLSLSRGMAVRSVLLASGVPSAQIYVRALGAAASDGPADRVELVVAPIGTVTR